MAPDWQLFTGGRYSEVVVKTGLTVPNLILIAFIFNFFKFVPPPSPPPILTLKKFHLEN